MATFKAEIQNKRADGTYNVRIRITHNAETRRLSTNIYVTGEDLTRSLKIKNVEVIEQCDDLIKKCRKICNGLGYEMLALPIDHLIEKLKYGLLGGDHFKLEFIKYMELKAAAMKTSTGKAYIIAANSIRRYIKRDTLDISEISVKFLKGFENFLEEEPSQRGNNRKGKQKDIKPKGGRAVSAYISCIRAIHNKAKKEYNDEDNGLIRIPYSPFKKYEMRPQPKTRKRALTVEVIQQIINLPYGKYKRRNLAKDCFILSFALIGMNSADMYYASPSKKQVRSIKKTVNGDTEETLVNEDIITYNRQKTADRRDDKAEMRVKIDSCLSLLIQKYKGRERLFRFHRMYANHENFNSALNDGLKQIGAELGIDDLEFYAARHSWATIARSSIVGIDKATVHEALNHADEKMKVTDIYIDRDWSVIWNANEKVLALFDWTAIGYDLL